MSDLPQNLKYTNSHEWVLVEGTQVTVGITDHAQQLLGDLVYVELPEVGTLLHKGEESGVVESVKAASDVYSPISGEVIAINEVLEAEPGKVNAEPYSDGWLYQVKLEDEGDLNDLLDADAYEAIATEDA